LDPELWALAGATQTNKTTALRIDRDVFLASFILVSHGRLPIRCRLIGLIAYNLQVIDHLGRNAELLAGIPPLVGQPLELGFPF